jgi:hypothetical protein
VEFAAAVDLVARQVETVAIPLRPQLRLITNGSQLGRPLVRQGIAQLGAHAGEVWFKVDTVGSAEMRRINGVALQPATVLQRLRQCGTLCPTWVQTCLFAFDGQPRSAAEEATYIELLQQAKDRVQGVHLYGIARPSHQKEAPRLSAMPPAWMEMQAEAIRKKTGLTVRVSP